MKLLELIPERSSCHGYTFESMPTNGPVSESFSACVYSAHFYVREAAGVSFSVCIPRTFTEPSNTIILYNNWYLY